MTEAPTPQERMNATRALVRLALLVLALAACSPAATAEPSRSVEVSPLPSARASIGASAGASPTASPAAPVAWDRVMTFVDDSAPNSSEVAREVVHGAAGFLAITETFVFGEGGPQLTGRRLWLSADGTTWEEVGFLLATEDRSLQALASTADGDYVLILATPTADGLGNSIEAMRSGDGRTWVSYDSGLPDNLGVQAIEHGARGWLLVADRIGGEVVDPGAWFSSDGATWEMVAELGEAGRWVRVLDAGAGDEGFVIVGTDAELDGPSHEWFALASADGRDWVESRPVFRPVEAGYQPDPHVAALGSGWVAALPAQDGSIQFWTSDDGFDWAEAGAIPHSGPEQAFDPVLQANGGQLYFSIVGGGYMYLTSGVWSSVDGISWEPLDLGADVRLGGVAAGSGTVVLSGTENTAQGSRAGIWVGRSD